MGETNNFIMCGSTYAELDGEDYCDAYEIDGIFFAHAYSILAVYEVNV